MRLRTGAAIAFVLAVLATTSCTTGAPAGPTAREQHTVERGAATRARVDVNMSAGDLTVNSGAAQLFAGEFAFNLPALKPAIAYAVEGTTGVLKVSQGSVSGNYENTWNLSLDEMTPVELHITLGAGDAKLVLGRLNLQSVAIALGAGDVVLDLLVAAQIRQDLGSRRGIDSNHRITSNLAFYQAQIAEGWSGEGVVMCAPN
jgi:hypothetical protein